MRGGSLRNIVRIEESYGNSKGRANEPVEKWRKYCEFFGSVESRNGREFFDKGQRYSETIYRFRGRYFDMIGVTEKMRVVFNEQVYNIKTVMVDADRIQDVIIDTSLIA